MDDIGQITEDQNVDRNADGENQSQEVSDRKEDATKIQTRGHVYYSLLENLSMFCSQPDTLQEKENKGNKLINVVEEISRRLNIQSVAWVLQAHVSQIIYSKNQGQKEKQKNLNFGPRRNMCKVGAKGRVFVIKKTLRTLQRNKKKNAFQESTRTQPSQA